jgi:hypothetical protein
MADSAKDLKRVWRTFRLCDFTRSGMRQHTNTDRLSKARSTKKPPNYSGGKMTLVNFSGGVPAYFLGRVIVSPSESIFRFRVDGSVTLGGTRSPVL